MNTLTDSEKKQIIPPTIKLGYSFALFAMVVDTLIAWQLDQPRAFNFGLCILGGCLGWMVGILLSPYSGEASRFSEYMKGISTLFTGYVLAKIDCWLSDKKVESITIVTVGRVMVFVIAFLIFTILVFVTRTYVGEQPVNEAADLKTVKSEGQQ